MEKIASKSVTMIGKLLRERSEFIMDKHLSRRLWTVLSYKGKPHRYYSRWPADRGGRLSDAAEASDSWHTLEIADQLDKSTAPTYYSPLWPAIVYSDG